MPLFGSANIHQRGDITAVEVINADGTPVADLFYQPGVSRRDMMLGAHSFLSNTYGYGLRRDDLIDPEEAERNFIRRFRDYERVYNEAALNIREYSVALAALNSSGLSRIARDFQTTLDYNVQNRSMYREELRRICQGAPNGDVFDQLIFNGDEDLGMTEAMRARLTQFDAPQQGGESVVINTADPFFFAGVN